MSGLVSKWATNEELSKEASLQDSNVKKSRARGASSGHSKDLKAEEKGSVVIGKTQQLESKWASSESESAPRTREHKRGHREGRKEVGRSTLPSPPSTARQNYAKDKTQQGRKNNRNKDKQGKAEAFREPGVERGDQRRRRGSKGDGSRATKPHDKARQGIEPAEELPPMSASARSLASRIGSVKAVDKVSSEEYETTDGENSDEPQDERAGSKKSQRAHQSDGEEEERPPMSDAGMSLASRLGGFSVNRDTAVKPAAKTKTPTAPYKTPMQQKRERLKLIKEEEDKRRREEEALKEERLKAEVNDMFERLQDSTQSWADIDD